ncbi:LLM class flavin-dependent oxidoreductase [Streptomyces sp. WMMC905]|uniref:LLM class flavin-dependent oxidoreductase n=1 Tax=Streptomyces sp. WMMC905 TaxID=3404123 RepID=UPI003B928E9E
MSVTVMRFNLVEPSATRASLAARYRAALEMAAYADDHGLTAVQTEEHHGSPDNWIPSPLSFAGAVLGATRRLTVTVSAAIGPLYDPLRLAEDIAVLDLLSGGRLVTVVGVGYRPEEYARAGVDFARRGRLQDELLATLLAAWTGEEFTHRGRIVRVTPRPFSDPHPPLMVGGASRPAARRAARFGLPFFPSAHLPELAAYYEAASAARGGGGVVVMPAPRTHLIHVAERPERVWAEYGGHFLHEARTYACRQPDGQRTAVRSVARTVEELRAEGVYRVLTPQECVELAAQDSAATVLHPLVGGMPPEEGWRGVRLFCERVLPRLRERAGDPGPSRPGRASGGADR